MIITKERLRTEEVDINLINCDGRERDDMGDIVGLGLDIKLNGLIHPIVITESKTQPGRYELIAGYRRILAHKHINHPTIRSQIVTDPTPTECKELQLSENLHRLDLSWTEQLRIKDQIFKLKFGEDYRSKMNKLGSQVTLQNMADVLDTSASRVSDDLRVLQAIESVPTFAGFKSKDDVMKVLKKVNEEHQKEKLATKIKSVPVDEQRQQLFNSYKVGDFFDLIETVPDESVDLINFDPDWGVDVIANKCLTKANSILSHMKYKQVPAKDFDKFLVAALELCKKKLKNGGWLLHWYDIKRQSEIADMTEYAGFTIGLRIPALWLKETGQTNQPKMYMPRTYEPFFYCRFGQSQMVKFRGSETFNYRNAPLKWHPALKPIELMQDIFGCFVTPGMSILDAFTGSGNAILAASNLQCTCVGFDLTELNKNNYLIHVMSQEPGSFSSYGYKPIKEITVAQQ